MIRFASFGGVNDDLGFCLQNRSVSIRRTGETARMLAGLDCIAIVALISPRRNGRTAVRQRHADTAVAFVEVHADAPLSVCEARDRKGFYRSGRTGEIPVFTLTDSPYEQPESPDMRCGESSPPEAVERIIARLLEGGAS